MPNRLLIVDDDVELCGLLTEFLSGEQFEVESHHAGTGAAERALDGTFSLVVLDVMLPGLDGFEILRQIRRRSDIPVILLTARGEDVDRIVGLELGATTTCPSRSTRASWRRGSTPCSGACSRGAAARRTGPPRSATSCSIAARGR